MTGVRKSPILEMLDSLGNGFSAIQLKSSTWAVGEVRINYILCREHVSKQFSFSKTFTFMMMEEGCYF